MATDTLTMASRKTASAIPWETWQRSHLLESAWMVDRFLMIFKVKSIDTVDNAGKQVDGIKRPREPPTGGTKMDIGRILPTEAAAILNVSPQFVRVAIETYLNEELDLEIKGDWQVFRFEYPVFDRDGNPVLDKNGKQVTKGRMLDFMGFQFHHDRTTIRKSNIESARRKANHISKQDKISWYNASVMLSYMGLFKHTDTYNYYIDYIKPKINVKKLKRIVSKHSRKENEHDRLEKGDRNTAGQAGGGRQDIVAVNGLPA